jgi:hypothetical protein
MENGLPETPSIAQNSFGFSQSFEIKIPEERADY